MWDIEIRFQGQPFSFLFFTFLLSYINYISVLNDKKEAKSFSLARRSGIMEKGWAF